MWTLRKTVKENIVIEGKIVGDSLVSSVVKTFKNRFLCMLYIKFRIYWDADETGVMLPDEDIKIIYTLSYE